MKKKQAFSFIKSHLRESNGAEIRANLKRNWYFPVSAGAFFCLGATLELGFVLAWMIAVAFSVLIASQIPSLWRYAKDSGYGLNLLSFASALGICLGGQGYFYGYWSLSSNIKSIEARLPVAIDIPLVMSICGAVAGFAFAYFCILTFWHWMGKTLSETKAFHNLTRGEHIICGILFGVTLGVMIVFFAESQAFYGTEYKYDILYTSDSPILVKNNVYLALMHPENDLRQPLFAVFSAPFAAIPHLIARVFRLSASVSAMLMNGMQLVLLFAANLLLTRIMGLDTRKRICFMVLTSAAYSTLLFSLMMEQYIVAYFWLVFFLYLALTSRERAGIAFMGAGGTLLTSAVLLPLLSDKNPVSKFREWLLDMVKWGFAFVGFLLVFCRFDVIWNFVSRISFLSAYSGKTVTLWDKVCQYTTFIRSCFAAPAAGVDFTAVDHVSWQLRPVEGISIAGVIILLAAVLSAVMNRKNKSSIVALCWIGFSVVMLAGLGWGTRENGLILYSLYFGWAFFMLLFQMAERLEAKIGGRFLLPILTAGAAVGMLYFNIPSIHEMFRFAATYYPV